MNKVILIGNLGKDPEVKHLESGTTVANVTLATSKKYTDKNKERKEETTWHDLVFWGKAAEIAEKYLRKGSKIAVEGEIKKREWEDKEGNKRYNTDITVREFEMLTAKADTVQDETSPSAQAAKAAETNTIDLPTEEDDLPF